MKTEKFKEVFKDLCKIQCTESEICAAFGETKESINKKCVEAYNDDFDTCYRKFKALGLITIRLNQYRLAKNNQRMADFLGKQYLGQSDKVEKAFDASAINALNKEILESIVEERCLEDFE